MVAGCSATAAYADGTLDCDHRACALPSPGWLTAQRDIRQLKESRIESQKSFADLRQQLDLLHKIDTQLAVMNNKVDDIATEVDRPTRVA